MNTYLRLLFIFISIWFISSLVNGMLSTAIIYTLKSDGNGYSFFPFLLSFIFSIPFVALSWLIATVARIRGVKGYALFKIVWHSSFFIAVGAAVLFGLSFSNELNEVTIIVCVGIVISAIFPLLIFRENLKRTE